MQGEIIVEAKAEIAWGGGWDCGEIHDESI